MTAKARRRSRFTLIELLITTAVAALALGSLGIGIYQSWKKEQFESAAGLLLEKMRVCQMIAFYEKQNVKLTVALREGGADSFVEMEKACPPYFEKLLSKPLKGVSVLQDRQGSLERIELTFSTSLGAFPRREFAIGLVGKKNLKKKIVVEETPHFALQNDSCLKTAPPYPQEVENAEKWKSAEKV